MNIYARKFHGHWDMLFYAMGQYEFYFKYVYSLEQQHKTKG